MKSILDTIKILSSVESGFEVPASKVLNLLRWSHFGKGSSLCVPGCLTKGLITSTLCRLDFLIKRFLVGNSPCIMTATAHLIF